MAWSIRYADDHALLVSGADIEEVTLLVNANLRQIEDWIEERARVVREKKTELVVSRRRKDW